MENTKRSRHYLACPNCSYNLLEKSSKSIPFFRQGITIFLVQICTDCLSNPEGLDEERMIATLMAEEWPEDMARRAARAIIEEARRMAIPAKPLSVEKILTTTTVAA